MVVCCSSSDDAHGAELWISDGTLSGTGRISDILPAVEDSLNVESRWSWGGFYQLGGDVYFAADDGVHGSEV